MQPKIKSFKYLRQDTAKVKILCESKVKAAVQLIVNGKAA